MCPSLPFMIYTHRKNRYSILFHVPSPQDSPGVRSPAATIEREKQQPAAWQSGLGPPMLLLQAQKGRWAEHEGQEPETREGLVKVSTTIGLALDV